MQCIVWFLWFWALTLRRAVAWTRLCTAENPCIEESLECTDAGDCVLRCVDEGVCANSSLLCGQSATGECHVRCEALDSCKFATVESNRDLTLKCTGPASCERMQVDVGTDTDNLTMNVSCDGLHSCFGSRFELHSEGGVATVQCADLATDGTETCEQMVVVCDMTATGHCQAEGDHYACDDSNKLICANSELCTADADCFVQLQTATVSFLISNGPLNESNECVGGVQMAAGSELPPNGLMACASLSDAYAKCSEMTQTGALKQWAEAVGLSTDLSNALANSCEFLFATFDDNQPIAVAAASHLAVDYEYGFEAHFYPWQHSVNSALRNALAEAGAVQKTEVGVEVNGSLLSVAHVAVDAFIALRALNFTAVRVLSAPLIAVTNAPRTAVQLSDSLWSHRHNRR